MANGKYITKDNLEDRFLLKTDKFSEKFQFCYKRKEIHIVCRKLENGTLLSDIPEIARLPKDIQTGNCFIISPRDFVVNILSFLFEFVDYCNKEYQTDEENNPHQNPYFPHDLNYLKEYFIDYLSTLIPNGKSSDAFALSTNVNPMQNMIVYLYF